MVRNIPITTRFTVGRVRVLPLETGLTWSKEGQKVTEKSRKRRKSS